MNIAIKLFFVKSKYHKKYYFVTICACTYYKLFQLGGGKLILISSDTGFVLGEPFALPLSSSATSPNTAANIAPATNIPPVLHTLKDGSQYVLFGSGGLNQPGGLHAIALPMFVRKVMGWNTTHAVPNTRGEYKAWDHATIDEKTGVVQIWG